MKKVVISRRNEGWALRDLNPRPPACRTSPEGAREVTRSTGKSHRSRGFGPLRRGAGLAVFGVVSALVLNKCAIAPDAGWGSPKAPQQPTMADVRKAATPYEMAVLRKTARCEQPGGGMWGVRWDTPGHWRFVGGYGMYRGTYAYGAQVAGVRRFPPAATPAEQSFVALAVARKWGWSAWDCN